MSKYYAIISLFCALLLFGCAHLPDDYGLYQEPVSDWEIEQNNSRLQNVANLLQTGKGTAAKQQVDAINPKELTKAQTAQYNLLTAQALLNFGEAEQAIKYLAKTDTGELEVNDKIKFYQSQAFAYSLTGNLLESAKARIGLDAFLVRPEERKKNQGVILETLGLLPDNIAQQQSQQEGIREWVTIAKILAARQRNPARFNSALASWRSTKPQHAANLYVANVANMSESTGETPASIAVLLPQTGPYADAGKAVKAGFLAAHSRENAKPALHFYDTETGKPAELYQKAISEGAKLVIGPLNKESIQNLANAGTLTVPVLALNHVPNLSKQNLYQFALSPVDDVAELTHKAALDGHINAVLLTPNNDQGKRIANYLTQHWQLLGGTVMKSLTYDPAKNDFSTAIKSMAGIDESKARIDNVKNAFPSANVVPQPNTSSGADVVFLSTSPKEGHAINTQIVQQASNIAVYALPTIYSGLPNPVADNPLNGITFCDTPWLFTGAYNGELSMMSLHDIINQFPTSYIRLVAMGIDAYYLSSQLPTLNTTPHLGATGKLSLESDNRIKRNLVCAKFVSGQPELIGFSQSPAETNYNETTKAVTGAPLLK
jgi:outer membrane PBP1 activator LpoA protein